MNENKKALELAEWLEDGQVDSDDNRYLDCAKELRRLVTVTDQLRDDMAQQPRPWGGGPG